MNRIASNFFETATVFLILVFSFAQMAFAQERSYSASERRELDLAKELTTKSIEQFRSANYSDAINTATRSLNIRKKILGNSHPGTAQTLNNLSMMYRSIGENSKAIPLMEQALSINERAFGSDDPTIATTINNLGLLNKSVGKYSEAEALLKRALNIRRRKFGNSHPETASCMSNLATVYIEQHKFDSAITLLKEAIEIERRTAGEESRSFGLKIGNLANIYVQQKKWNEALPLVRRELEIMERALDADHPDLAMGLAKLAEIYESQNKYAQALPVLQKALIIREKKLGAEHPDVAYSLNQIGLLQVSIGNYGKGIDSLKRALAIREASLGNDHPILAQSLHNLGQAYKEIGNYKRALPLLVRALEIREKELGTNHVLLAPILDGLAGANHELGDDQVAIELAKRAFNNREKAFGQSHPEFSTALNNLGFMYLKTGELEKALPLLQRSLENGKANKSDTLPTYWNLADVHLAKRSIEPALEMLNKANIEQIEYVARALPALTRQQQQRFLFSNFQFHFKQSLAAAFEVSEFPEVNNAAATWLINGKAVSHDALARQNQSSQSEAAPVKWVELNDVRKVLPDQSVLIEIIRFRERDIEEIEYNYSKPYRYAAWLIPREGDVKVVDLGLAANVDAAVFKVTSQLSDPSTLLEKFKEAGEQEAVAQLNKDLAVVSDLVWKPIAAKLQTETNSLIISPDSSLWLLPWTALPMNEGRYLIEDYSIRLEVSGRYLVKDFSTKKKFGRPFIFADPDFDLNTDETQKAIKAMFPKKELSEFTRGTTSQSALSRVGRLPNTKLEAEAVAPNMSKIAGQEPRTYTGKWAMETVLKEVRNPKILMLATHGFFLPDQKVKQTDRTGFNSISNDRSAALLSLGGKPVENPLLRCGLLFAGCNTGSAIGGDDGILTGMEVVGLNLRGTEMVVLSACETGIGDVNNGEGVAGLRQAFQLAGAQSVVATLWSVPDRDSAIIMNDFFKNLANGQTRSEALRQAQLTRIKARRARHGAAHPFFWAAFTLTGQD